MEAVLLEHRRFLKIYQIRKIKLNLHCSSFT